MKHSTRRNRLRSGLTTVELLTAATISTLVLGVLMSTMIMGSSSWIRGLGRIEAEGGSQMAIKRVSDQLREAMVVQVDASGKSLTYRLPMMDKTKQFIYPLTWDGVTRSIALVGTDLILSDGQTNVTLARGVAATDPMDPGHRSYKVFIPGPGLVTRQVTLQLALDRNSYKREIASSRTRETIFLRNISAVTK